MWPLFILSLLLVVGGRHVLEAEQRHASTVPQEEALAINMAVYRGAVVKYLNEGGGISFAGPSPTAPDNGIQSYFPPGYIRHSAWKNIVQPANHQVIIYASSPLPVSITAALTRIAGYSQFAGEALNNVLYVPAPYVKGQKNDVELGLPSSIPKGSPVWLAAYFSG
jgi:hypothetical protein